MTKADLISVLAETGMSKKESAAAVDAVIDAIKGALAKGEKGDHYKPGAGHFS